MDAAELEAAARALYERNAPVAPRWEQLGDITRGVWREQAADPAAYAASRKVLLRHAVHAAQSELAHRKEHRA